MYIRINKHTYNWLCSSLGQKDPVEGTDQLLIALRDAELGEDDALLEVSKKLLSYLDKLILLGCVSFAPYTGSIKAALLSNLELLG